MASILATSTAGIDIGDTHIAAAEVRDARGEARIRRALRFERRHPGASLDDEEVSRAFRILGRHGFGLGGVVAGLRNGVVRTRVLEIPGTGEAVASDLVLNELARVHHWSDGRLEFSHWTIPPPARQSDRTHVMTIACSHSEGEAYLGLFERHCDVKALDVQMQALVRACWRATLERSVLIAHIEQRALTLAFLCEGVEVYEREIVLDPGGTSGRMIGPQRQAWLARVLKESRASLEFFQVRYPDCGLQELCVAGAEADDPDVRDGLEQELALRTRIVHPRDVVRWSEDVEGAEDPSLAVAVGLALFGAA